MPIDNPAADLPGIEPTAADLAAIEHLPWQDTQAHLEELLAETATAAVHRAVVSPVRQLPARTPATTTQEVAA